MHMFYDSLGNGLHRLIGIPTRLNERYEMFLGFWKEVSEEEAKENTQHVRLDSWFDDSSIWIIPLDIFG